MEHIIGFDALYESMEKCRKGVIWKDSVAHFVLNAVEETMKLERQLKSGEYHSHKGHIFMLESPKKRQAMGIPFRDRVYQRSLCDNEIYPEITKHLIPDNFACQTGKGTDAARNRIKQFLRRIYIRDGGDCYALQCDIKGYYPNMSHKVAEANLRQYLKPEVADMAIEILREQYEGDVGYLPGSQLVQLLGISILNPMDHYIKEKLRIKEYIRYMDDFILFHKDKEYLEYCKEQIEKGLNARGYRLHPKKTRIFHIKQGFRFLGFDYKLTNTGKVLMFIDPRNVKMERRRLRRMANLVKKGRLTRHKVDECYKCWRNHASKGSSRKLLKRMDTFYKDLWC